MPKAAKSRSASSFRTVRGSRGFAFASRIPKRPLNFANGGYSSVPTANGKRFSLTRERPASSRTSAESFTRKLASGGKGALNLTLSTRSDRNFSGSQIFPPAPTRAIPSAASREIGAEKLSLIPEKGIHPFSLFSLWQ